jgi:two-component system, chemotaxis family, chemotaxis protein CheY
MGDLKMTYPSIMTTPSRSTVTVQRHLAWGLDRRRPVEARPEPCGEPPSSTTTAADAGITPRRAAAPKVVSWVAPHRSAEGDQKNIGTARFVLIVDDDPDLLDVTSFVIENEGMAVETARNGEEALALIGTGRRPALVLLDLMMPVMNGWEFLATVANDPVLQGLPVVVLTAAEHTEVPGALEVLSKPMDLKELLRVVERYVRGDRDAGA